LRTGNGKERQSGRVEQKDGASQPVDTLIPEEDDEAGDD
jgi:hypothetical protein